MSDPMRCPSCRREMILVAISSEWMCTAEDCPEFGQEKSKREIENVLDDAFERASVRALADGGGASASYLADMRDSGRAR